MIVPMVKMIAFFCIFSLSILFGATFASDAENIQKSRLIKEVGIEKIRAYDKTKNRHLEALHKNIPNFSFVLDLSHGVLQVKTIHGKIVSRFYRSDQKLRGSTYCNDKLLWYGNGWGYIDDKGTYEVVLSGNNEHPFLNYVTSIICDRDYYYVQFKSKIAVYNLKFKLMSEFDISPFRMESGLVKSGNDLYFSSYQNVNQGLLVLDVSNPEKPRIKKQFLAKLSNGVGFFYDVWVTPGNFVYLKTTTLSPGLDYPTFTDHINVLSKDLTSLDRKLSFDREDSRIKFHSLLHRSSLRFLVSINSDFLDRDSFDLERQQCNTFLCSIIPEKHFKYALASLPNTANGSKLKIHFLEMSPYLRATQVISKSDDDIKSQPIIFIRDKFLYIYDRKAGVQVNDVVTGNLLGFYPLEFPQFGY